MGELDLKTSLTPVFSHFGFHLEWTRMPHFSSSIVLSLVVLGDTCVPVCLTVVFMEMGKGMKVIQNEHRRWTANYEREEGWRGRRSRRRRLVSSTATICPLVPSSHSPCLSTHFFFLCSELFKMLCVLSFMLVVMALRSVSAVWLNISAEISAPLRS